MRSRAPALLSALTASLLAACSSAPAPVVAPPKPPPPPLPSAFASAVPAVPSAPPVAPVREVRDTYFGIPVVDPYRWMEEPGSPELATWMKAEADHARRTLDALPERAALLARLQELDNAGSQVFDAQPWGGRYFYLVAEPGKDGRRLYVRNGSGKIQGGPERLLVDPEALGKSGEHVAIDWFAPSIDGRLVAYGLSRSGSEDSVLHVVETDSGRVLPDAIDRARFGDVAWRDDGRSFFYTRLPKPAAGASGAQFRGTRVHVHALGEEPESDPAVFGAGVTPAIPIRDDDVSFAVAPPGSRYVFAAFHHGVADELSIFSAPRSSLAGASTPWRKLTDADTDEVVGFDVHGDDLFLLSHHGAPRGKVLRLSLANPDLARAGTVIAESEAVITALGVARDGLYVRELDAGLGRVRRLPWRGKARVVETIALPVQGAVQMFFTQPLVAGALFQLTSWTTSPRWETWDPAEQRIVDTGLVPPSLVDFSAVLAREVKVKSADGTEVPLSIVHLKDLPRDGSHPTWLSGYGAYGATRDPGFSPTRLAWLERGGVYALCHVRGGGEGGEAWHRAGMRGNKQRSIDDFLACAKYLADEKLTAPAHLAAEGRSAGGLVAGGALTQHPEMFGAALLLVGYANALRLETMPAGPLNVPEFGSVATEEGFRGLFAMDAYQHVKPGTPYPAVLLTAGIADARVAPWQPAKMAARLQAATSSGKPVLLRVDYDAGHGMGATRSQRQAELADTYAFLLQQLGHP